MFRGARRQGPFSADDDRVLREAIGVHDLRTIAVLLGRGVVELRRRVRALRAEVRTGPWSAAESRELRRRFGTRSLSDLATMLARSEDDIAARAAELCLGRDKAARDPSDAPLRMPRWTAAEIKRLRQIYPRTDSIEVARALGRSVSSVRNKASQLGLGKGVAALAAMGRRNVGLRHSRQDP
ncbi:MAG: hypothetical protein U1F36_01150 [Planctomycetota bacterium]